jgi:hypothetical protein
LDAAEVTGDIELGQKVAGIIAVLGRDTGQSSVLFERKVE